MGRNNLKYSEAMKRFLKSTITVILLLAAGGAFSLMFIVGTELPIWTVAVLGGAAYGSFRLAEKINKVRLASGESSQN